MLALHLGVRIVLALNLLLSFAALSLLVIPRRPVFLMRTWSSSWVEPRRWWRAVRGWVFWWLHGRRRVPAQLVDLPLAEHDPDAPLEELLELVRRCNLGAVALADHPEDLEGVDACDLASIRAAVHQLDHAARALTRLAGALSTPAPTARACAVCGRAWDDHEISGTCPSGGGRWR